MEEAFTNESIDTSLLPKLEDVVLTPLHSSYIKVIWFNVSLVFLIIAGIAGAGIYFIDEIRPFWLPLIFGFLIILAVTIVVQLISFKNKGFAFRTHDVIYRTGAISITTSIIPYTRVQHVAQHEGIFSRMLGLAAVEIFTAGATGSDIKIPGLEKIHATAIKKLLVNKIEDKVNEATESDVVSLNTDVTDPYNNGTE